MKKVLFGLLGVGIIGVVIFNRTQRAPETENAVLLSPTPTQTIDSDTNSPNLFQKELPYNGQTLTVLIYKVPRNARLTLVPNFSQKESALEIAQKNNCLASINGGFYTEDGKPLGLLETGGKQYGNQINSNLVTGYIYQQRDKLTLSFNRPVEETAVDFILQTGPLFILPRFSQVSVIRDKPSRRSLIGQDDIGTTYLLIMYEKDNAFSGPNLTDLPKLVSSNEIQAIAKITKVINLDGGSASFFYSEEGFVLSELISVGSVLCVQSSE